MSNDQRVFKRLEKIEDGDKLTLPSDVKDYLDLLGDSHVLLQETSEGLLVRGVTGSDYIKIRQAQSLIRSYQWIRVKSVGKGYGKTHLISKLVLNEFDNKKVLVVGTERYRDEIELLLKQLDEDNNVALSVVDFKEFIRHGLEDIKTEGFSAVILEGGEYLEVDAYSRLLNVTKDKACIPFFVEQGNSSQDSFKYQGYSLVFNLMSEVRSDINYNDYLEAFEYAHTDEGRIKDVVRFN